MTETRLRAPVLVDSITDFVPGPAAQVIVTGSHCGPGIAQYLAGASVLGLIANDAGGRALVALATLDRFGVAAAAVSSASARIGRAGDTLERGDISAANTAASSAGVRPGMPAGGAVELLQRLAPRALPAVVGYGARRREIRREGGVALLLADSASLVTAADAGRIIITGSHGGLVGGAVARGLRAQARLAVFNDAGVGRDGAGIARLAVLEAAGVPAVAVAAASADIGSALSTYRRGVVSAANAGALALGFRAGFPLRDRLDGLI